VADRAAAVAVAPAGDRAVPKDIVLAQLWRRYASTRDRVVRDQLILAYSPLVKYLAGRIASTLPSHVDLADLISFGLGGLIGAVERYEPARGVRFETFAGVRIRGAIYDEMRSEDWVPRTVRDEAKSIVRATADLTTRLQRVPVEAELAVELSMSDDELGAALLRAADAHVIALDQPSAVGGDGGSVTTMLDLVPDDGTMGPAASADAVDLRERIAVAVDQLPARERLVLGLRYQQQLNMTEIGKILELTESRISQLHSKAIIQLRTLLPDERAITHR
jgi:RNA polymerase sigma factor for flagellar operon FliA